MKILWFIFLSSIIFAVLIPYKHLLRINKENVGKVLEFIGSHSQSWFQQVTLENVQFTVKSKKWTSQKRYKLMHITDIHADLKRPSLIPFQHLQKILQFIRNEKPDYLFITGDFIHADPRDSLQWLSQIFVRNITDIMEEFHQGEARKQRVFGTLGNHDLKIPNMKNHAIQVLETVGGIKILDNEHIILEEPSQLNGSGLLLIGLGDYQSGEFAPESVSQKLKTLKNHEDYISIVLSHQPDSAECILLRNEKNDLVPPGRSKCDGIPVNLVLSGHTHAGQIRLPLVDYPLLPFLIDYLLPNYLLKHMGMLRGLYQAVNHWEWSQGLMELKTNETILRPLPNDSKKNLMDRNRFLYVGRGIGSHKGIRINCNPEVTAIHILPP